MTAVETPNLFSGGGFMLRPSTSFRARRCLRRHPAGPRRHLLLEQLESRLAPSVNVTQYRYDNANTGQNLAETVLTPANVHASTFGKLVSTPVDGQVYAQPLIVTGVNITAAGQQGVHDLALVTTQHDSVYAIDANTGVVLWHDSFINPAAGITTVSPADCNCTDTS